MSTNLITISPETKLMHALDLMKQHDIHRLPVIDQGKFIGLVTEEIIAKNSPSTATSLSVHELNYLLNKTVAKDIMIKQVVTVKQDTILEEAAALMLQKQVGVLPVVEGLDKLIGIITDKDIFNAFIDISGYRTPGTRITIELNQDKKGMLEEVASVLKDHDLNITQIMVYRQEPKVLVIVHIESEDVDNVADYIAQRGYHVVSAFRK